jgi:hypothetical protein
MSSSLKLSSIDWSAAGQSGGERDFREEFAQLLEELEGLSFS